MSEVTIYTKSGCPYCAAAIDDMQRRGVRYSAYRGTDPWNPARNHQVGRRIFLTKSETGLGRYQLRPTLEGACEQVPPTARRPGFVL